MTATRGYISFNGINQSKVHFLSDGTPLSNRVENFTERKLYAAVVDNILNSSTYASRLMGLGKPFTGKVYDYTVRISYDTQGQWVTGMETLNAAAVDDTIQLSYADTQFVQPKVSIMWESFDNAGPLGTINLDAYKLRAAAADAMNAVATALYQVGAAPQINGLGNIVDNGTLAPLIGGQARSTYPVLNAIVTPSSGTMTLTKLATLDDDASATGLVSETPTINLTTKTVWSLYESLLDPTVRANYGATGGGFLGIREIKGYPSGMTPDGLKGMAGFTMLEHRGEPVIKDDKCADPSTVTGGPWFKLNERYLEFRGRSEVPSLWKDYMTKVDLGESDVYEGVGAQYKPSDFNGWFFRKDLVIPDQAGSLGYFVLMGQVCTDQPRRQAKLTGITGVA